MNREDINELLKKSKLMFGVSKFSTIEITLTAFLLSGIPLIINSSLELYLIELSSHLMNILSLILISLKLLIFILFACI